jgi:hypothetical protein
MSVPNPAANKPVTAHPLNIIVATDCGSTTTKAILIEKVGDEYRQTYRGEAPTTVEAPFEDVTRGVLNAIAEVEELYQQRGRRVANDGDRSRSKHDGGERAAGCARGRRHRHRCVGIKRWPSAA